MEGAGSAAWETAKGLPGGFLKLLDPTEPFRHPGDMPIVRSIREMASAAKDPDTAWWEVPAAGAGSLVGMSAESAREHARCGEGGSIIGEAAVPTAMAIGGELASQTGLAPRVAEKVGAARESVGDAIHNPETGKMTPGAARVARTSGIIAGGGAGHLIPIPGAGSAGALAGYTIGPSLLERMFPESAGRVSIREAAQQAAQDELLRQEVLKNPALTSKQPLGPEPPMAELGSPDNPGWVVKIPDRMPEAKASTPELGSPENPGWVVKLPDRMPAPEEPADPLAMAIKEGRAAKIPMRMPTPEKPMSITDPRIVRQDPFGTPPESRFVKAARPQNPVVGIKGTRPEGRPATWTNEAVRDMASWGDPDAIKQAQLRGFGRIPLQYDQAMITPRSVTRFDAEGNPIEAGAREAIPQGNPTPFGKSIIEMGAPTLRREVQEFVAPSKAMMTPEWLAQENSYEAQKARDILRNPIATDEEKAVAQARLRENQ
jgi:hypothetical protein